MVHQTRDSTEGEGIMKPPLWSKKCKMHNKRVMITRFENRNTVISIKHLMEDRTIHEQGIYLKEDTLETLIIGLIKMSNATRES